MGAIVLSTWAGTREPSAQWEHVGNNVLAERHPRHPDSCILTIRQLRAAHIVCL